MTATKSQISELQAFGERLRELRLAEGLSQEELAARSGLDRTYLSSTERGKRNISLKAMHSLATALKTTPANFFPPKEAA